jgi:hypothetical protein
VLIAVEIMLAAGVLSSRIAGHPLIGATAAHATDLSTSPLPAKDRAAIEALLAGRARALLARDRRRFLATADPQATGFRGRQDALFTNLAGVPLARWHYAVGEPQPVPAPALARYGAPVWAAEVTLTHALTGPAGTPASTAQYLTFVRRSGRWYVGGDDDLRPAGHVTVRDLWDFGPVTVLSTPHGAVLGDPSGADRLDEIRDMLVRAVPRVSAIWPDWPRRTTVVLSRGPDEIAAMVPDIGELGQTAAATSGALGDRIVVNPGPFRALGAAGREAVLTHELTHIATSAVTSASTPVWLSEGFADFVGNSGRTEPPGTIARQLAAAVRAGRVPGLLPSEGEFDPAGPRLAEAYDGSWLACRLIASRYGQDALTRLYRLVSAGPGTPEAAADSGLRSVLALTSEQFTAMWRDYLRAELS